MPRGKPKSGEKPVIALARTDPARARLQGEKEQRVDHIVSLMARGDWAGTRTTLELAEQWGCTRFAVAEYAATAGAVMRRLVMGDPESIRQEILAGIERLRLIATETTKFERVGPTEYIERRAPNVEAALRAYELRAKMLGLIVQNVKVSEEIAKLPDDELRRQYEAMRKRVASESEGS